MPGFGGGRYSPERLTQTFLTGVVGILPLALTLAVLVWLIRLLHDLAGPASLCGKVLTSAGMSVVACDLTAYIIGLIGVLILVYVLGVMIESGAGGGWRQTMDSALHRIPVLGTVYDASKQMTSMFDRKQDSRQSMTPVMCYLGGDRSAAIPALMPTSEPVRLGNEEYLMVIIPTAPVPFGGALLCVRTTWIEPVACGFEELVGVYMSMGVTAPRALGQAGGHTADVPPPVPGSVS